MSGDLRRSRWRRDDGLLGRLFFIRYRCRDCRERFSRFNGRLVATSAAVVLILGAAITGGWALLDQYESHRETAAAESAVEAPGSSTVGVTTVAYPGLSELAERGDARAQVTLAMAYLNGQGVARNAAVALRWSERSARQGHAEGQYLLASLHLTGRGTLQNFQKASEWFEKAAHQNHAESQYRLGSMYRSGHGVGVDKARAYVWFSLAAAQGHQRAAEDRDSLLTALTADQIALAQREAQAWQPSSAKP